MATPKTKAILALLLLVPAPTIGVLAAMVWWPNTRLGLALFSLSKLWLFVFPLLWYVLADRGKLSLSPVRNGGLFAGLVSGGLISLAIAAGYWTLAAHLLDPSVIIRKMHDIGLDSWPAYAAGAAYWTLVNSVLEEYVWRWFVGRQCEVLMRPSLAAVCAAGLFTLHHSVALQVYCNAAAVLICSCGVFLGGLVWSFLYMRYRSIWAGYLSHAIVDLCIFLIGATIVFGTHATR